MLRLQAQAGSIVIDASLAGLHAVHEVARVELQSGLRCEHVQHPTAGPVGEPRRKLQRLAVLGVQHPVVVVTVPDAFLAINAAAYNSFTAKIERSARDWAQFTRWNERSVHRRELCCGSARRSG